MRSTLVVPHTAVMCGLPVRPPLAFAASSCTSTLPSPPLAPTTTTRGLEAFARVGSERSYL